MRNDYSDFGMNAVHFYSDVAGKISDVVNHSRLLDRVSCSSLISDIKHFPKLQNPPGTGTLLLREIGVEMKSGSGGRTVTLNLNKHSLQPR